MLLLNGHLSRSILRSARYNRSAIVALQSTYPHSQFRCFSSFPKLCQNQPSPSVKPKIPDVAKSPIEQANDPQPPKIIDNIYTVPNLLTMTRIITTPVIGYCIYTGHSTAAISLFTYSCITDFLDGFIARKFNMKSILGTILDPIADKLLMGICTISLSLVSVMPGYLGALIIGKDAMLALMGVYYRYITLPVPKTFQRFINLSIPTVSVEPNMLSKVNTGLQMIYIGNLVFKPQLEQFFMSDNYDIFLHGFEVTVAVTTVLSGLSYIFSSRSIKSISSQLKLPQ